MSHLATGPFSNQSSNPVRATDLPPLSKFEELTGLIGEAAADPSFASLALNASRNLRAAARQVLAYRLSQVADPSQPPLPAGYTSSAVSAPPGSSHQMQSVLQPPTRAYGVPNAPQSSFSNQQLLPSNAQGNPYQYPPPVQNFPLPQQPRYPIPLPVAPQQLPQVFGKQQPPLPPPPPPARGSAASYPPPQAGVVGNRPESAPVSKKDEKENRSKPTESKPDGTAASKPTSNAQAPSEPPKPRTYDPTVPHLYQKQKGEYRMARGSAESQHAPNLVLKTKQDLDEFLAKHPNPDTQLKVLDAAQFKNLSPEQLLKVGEKAPFLAQVTLGYNTLLKTKTIEAFCQLCPYIESFDLKGVPLEQGTFESRVVPSLPRLKYVDIRDTPAGRALAGWPTSKIEKHFRRPSLLIDL